jgi:general secretion pathway protein D
MLVTGALGVWMVGCAGEAPRPERPEPVLAQAPQQDDPPAAAPEQQADEEAPRAFGPPEDGTGGRRGGARGPMGDLERELSLEQQERKALAENYYKTGKRLFQEMRYREAEDNLHRAVKLDPSHADAERLLDRTRWITGDRRAEHKETVRVMAEERLAKIQQAKVELDRLMTEGDLLMDRQRYEEAQERYQRVLEAIRWFPYNIDQGGAQTRAESKIAEARRLADEQARRRRHMLQEAARQAAEFDRANNRRFLEATLKALFEDAKDAYRASRYEKCETICDDILRRQPDHAEAANLKSDAQDAAYREEVEASYRNTVEHWRRQIEWVEDSAIPWQELFRFPGAERWAEISARDIPIRELLEQRRGASEEEMQINRRLASQRITLNFDQTPFDEAINFLRDITGLNYVLSADARDLVDSEGVLVSLRLREITLDNALKLILASHESLAWRIEDGVIKIGTDTDAVEDLILEFYDVTEIVNSPPDFPAPELGLNLESGGGGGAGSTGGVLSFDDEDEEAGQGIDADTLIELIESKLGEDDEDGSVEYSGGILIVRKPLRSHEKILKLLDALRRTVGVMVTVEARFVEVQDNMLEQIGIDLINQPGQPPQAPPDTFGQINNPRGSGSGPANTQVGYNYTDAQGQTNMRAGIVNALSSLAPAGLPFNITRVGGLAMQFNFLDDFQLQAVMELVRKTQKSKIVNAPRITVFNGQRSHILNISQRAYIQDVEVNQTGVIPVLNPVIGIINTGAILEVRPTVSHDRRYVTLEVKPTLATELPPRIPAPVTLAGGFTSIPIELPVITIRKLRATVTVPDGGTVLLGGLKNFDEFEGVSGVPFLMRIPLLNNLFRRQAFHRLRASLVVLLKADITIIREREKDIFGRD